MAGWDSIKVQIAWASTPFTDPPTYTDITADVLDIRITRGRDNALDRFPAGTATLELDNSAGTYDVLNAAGPYYGNLLPYRQVLITAVKSGGVTGNLYKGFILPPPEGWTYNYALPGESTLTLRCVDLLNFLARYNLTQLAVLYSLTDQQTLNLMRRNMASDIGSFGGELSNARVTRVLNTVGIPVAWRSIDVGLTLLQPTIFGTTALEHLYRVAESEGGALWVTASGTLRYHNRHAPIRETAMTTSGATFSDTPTGNQIEYEDPTYGYGQDQWNQAQIGREGGPVQVYSDAAAITKTGSPITLERVDLFYQNDPEGYARAEWIVKQFKDPLFAPATITLDAVDTTAAMDQVIAGELRNRITVAFTPPGLAQRSTDCFIEKIEHVIPVQREPRTWKCTYTLSNANRWGFTNYADYLVFDSATQGTFGTSPMRFGF